LSLAQLAQSRAVAPPDWRLWLQIWFGRIPVAVQTACLRSSAETLGDVQSGDVVRFVMCVIAGVWWCVRGCIAESQVLDLAGHSFGDIPEGLVISTVSNSFASYTVLLVGKDESNEGAPLHVMQRTDGCVEIVLGWCSEENVLQPER